MTQSFAEVDTLRNSAVFLFATLRLPLRLPLRFDILRFDILRFDILRLNKASWMVYLRAVVV